ncbi:unnamed protein product [Lupinus luteus]|uniref:CCHC-type domain-containing protein n=1 Tax=Lupinus luteus TaxID=3873 RepID=A0AAV1XPY8_LUPLU
MNLICFQCGKFGHRAKSCPTTLQDKVPGTDDNTEVGGRCSSTVEAELFGEWMLAKRDPRNGKRSHRVSNPKVFVVSNVEALNAPNVLGSRFSVLHDDAINDGGPDSMVIPPQKEDTILLAFNDSETSKLGCINDLVNILIEENTNMKKDNIGITLAGDDSRSLNPKRVKDVGRKSMDRTRQLARAKDTISFSFMETTSALVVGTKEPSCVVRPPDTMGDASKATSLGIQSHDSMDCVGRERERSLSPIGSSRVA